MLCVAALVFMIIKNLGAKMGLSCLKFLMLVFASQTDELDVKDQSRVGWNNAPKPSFTYTRASTRKANGEGEPRTISHVGRNG